MGAEHRDGGPGAREELLGEPASGAAQKQTVDALLGRPYVAERSVVRGVGRHGAGGGGRPPPEPRPPRPAPSSARARPRSASPSSRS